MKSPSLIVLATILDLVQHSSQGELKQLNNKVKDTALKTVTESFDKEEKRYVRQIRRPQTEEQILVPEHSNIAYLGLLPEPNELEYTKYNHETRRRRPYWPKHKPRPGRPTPRPGRPKPRPGRPTKPRPPELEFSFEFEKESEEKPIPLKFKKDSKNVNIPMMIVIASRK